MTDYLELAAGEDAAVLWEASREKGVPIVSAQEGLPGETGLTSSGEGKFPLLEALDRVDWQTQGGALAAAARRNTEEAGSLSGGSGRRAYMGEGSTNRETLPGAALIWGGTGQREDHLWVKQVDLAFQRDSRRYDGTFSLY